ncbi:RebB family R body protein [Shewanella surugensis]|uniref:RebB family R body protein n=1 Tax=Shewanella surugensis TaxID=212020 RepID=A0ABT0LEG4_9GAMM|nr:RebB family R body protein [Shewanella surugensis]MCL1126092.1 RebB family R body protein [Shewanella surugensis]
MSTISKVMDSIALINAMNVSMAPAMAMGSMYMNMSNSMGMAAMNNVFAQQQMNINQQAVLVLGIKKIYAFC